MPMGGGHSTRARQFMRGGAGTTGLPPQHYPDAAFGAKRSSWKLRPSREGGGRASRDDVNSPAVVAKLTKPQENLDSLHILVIPVLSSSSSHERDFWKKKKKKKALSGPGSGKGIVEVDTSGSLGECGIPGPRAGGGAGTSRDSRDPRSSGVCGYGCDSGQRRLLPESEETVQQLAGERDPVNFPREPLFSIP